MQLIQFQYIQVKKKKKKKTQYDLQLGLWYRLEESPQKLAIIKESTAQPINKSRSNTILACRSQHRSLSLSAQTVLFDKVTSSVLFLFHRFLLHIICMCFCILLALSYNSWKKEFSFFLCFALFAYLNCLRSHTQKITHTQLSLMRLLNWVVFVLMDLCE